MLNKQQKQNLFGAIGLVIILLFIVLTSKPDFVYKETSVKKRNVFSNKQILAYDNYLKSLELNTEASVKVFDNLLSKQDVQKLVLDELKITNSAYEPDISKIKINILNQETENEVVSYLAKISGSSLNFQNKIQNERKELFSDNIALLNALLIKEKEFFNELVSMPVSSATLTLHKAVIKIYLSYENLIQSSINQTKLNNKDWSELYRTYISINNQAKIVNNEIKVLEKKYKISHIKITPLFSEVKTNNWLEIKSANAFLGIGDVTITLGDIPRIIMDSVEQGLVASFSQFMGSMLEKLITKIESNYLIANFLYYTDALVAGQYVDDYLQKYVVNTLDRKIIKNFIPQFSCGKSIDELKPLFQIKAQEYLGFKVEDLKPSDPNFYNKLAKVGDFMASPIGWEQYYSSLAEEAKTEAEKAADRELLSSGLKSPRDTLKQGIAVSISNIKSASQASLTALLNLGLNNAESFISGFVAELTQSLVNKFVFRGAVSAGQGGLGVLKEQSVCLASAQFSPVLPINLTEYKTPPSPKTPEEILRDECAKFPRGCTVLPAE